LSQQRADSVRRYLIDRGVEGRRLTASGVGFDRPIAGNDTATGRQQNRRVEVIIENKE
jgi:outer membrane protein OmpA-like peptidoglycan-associated protein